MKQSWGLLNLPLALFVPLLGLSWHESSNQPNVAGRCKLKIQRYTIFLHECFHRLDPAGLCNHPPAN